MCAPTKKNSTRNTTTKTKTITDKTIDSLKMLSMEGKRIIWMTTITEWIFEMLDRIYGIGYTSIEAAQPFVAYIKCFVFE